MGGTSLSACRVCRAAAVVQRLDFGPQPICNRYLANPGAEETLFPLGLSQCEACGVIQITEAAPAPELRPRFDWIRYDEAEGHLDDMVDQLIRITGLKPDARLLGLTYKDASTLERFRKRGFPNGLVLDPAKDLDADFKSLGMETVQDRLTPARAAAPRGWPRSTVAPRSWSPGISSSTRTICPPSLLR